MQGNYCSQPWILWMKQLATSLCWLMFNSCFSGSHVLFSKEFPIHSRHSQGSLRWMCSAKPTHSEFSPPSRQFLQLQLVQGCCLDNSGSSWWLRITKFCTVPIHGQVPCATHTCWKKNLEVHFFFLTLTRGYCFHWFSDRVGGRTGVERETSTWERHINTGRLPPYTPPISARIAPPNEVYALDWKWNPRPFALRAGALTPE